MVLKDVARLLLSFRGVVSRTQFLAPLLVLLGLFALVDLVDRQNHVALSFAAACMWPYLALSVKRLRAVGRPFALLVLPWALFVAAWLFSATLLVGLVFLMVLAATPLLGGNGVEQIAVATFWISVLPHIVFVVWLTWGRHPVVLGPLPA